MTRDEIINLAFEHTVGGLEFNEEGLLRFVQIIDDAARAAEREECAKVCETLFNSTGRTFDHRAAAAAIRARGQT